LNKGRKVEENEETQKMNVRRDEMHGIL